MHFFTITKIIYIFTDPLLTQSLTLLVCSYDCLQLFYGFMSSLLVKMAWDWCPVWHV